MTRDSDPSWMSFWVASIIKSSRPAKVVAKGGLVEGGVMILVELPRLTAYARAKFYPVILNFPKKRD